MWLREHGFDPPYFQVFGPEHWKPLMHHEGGALAREIRVLELSDDPYASAVVAARVRASIRRWELPDQVAGALTKDFARGRYGRYAAVRSSAISEDGPEASSAGQYESVLGVRDEDEAVAAVKHVLASYFAPRAVTYRRARGLRDEGLAMAVVVQALIEADVSGVAFSVDPLRPSSNCCVVEATWGLGEVLVSGRVSPDRWIVARDLSIVEQHLGTKTVSMRATEAGPELIESDADTTGGWCLTESQVRELAESVFRADQLAGLPVDIEWVAQGHGSALSLSFVQIRPITALGNANPVEAG